MHPIRTRTPFLCFAAVMAAIVGLSTACFDIGAVQDNLDAYTAEFARKPLSMNPVEATSAGYHVHQEQGDDGPIGPALNLDEMLGDYSSGGIAERVTYYKSMETRLADREVIPERRVMNGVRFIDSGVMENRVKRALFHWEKEQPHVNDPNFYVELLGNALFTPLTLDYAPEADRYGHIIARLEKLPALIEQAKQNLSSSSELQIESAVEETQGLITLIQQDIRASLPAGLEGSYEAASAAAVESLEGYLGFLENDLSATGDWRLGGGLFEEKVAVLTDVTFDAGETLAALEAEYDETYKQLIDTAKPIHRKIYGNQRPPNDFALMRDILDVVSDENRLRSGDGLVSRTSENIEEVKRFMQAEEVVETPSVGLEISDTPSFLRGKNPVAAFQAPPVLDPSKGARYWITPIPANWSRLQTLAKLREYNNYKLKVVAVEGFARYVQAMFSADVEYENSRLIRNVDPNRGYTSGWVWYLVDSAISLGFQAGKDEFKLNWYKYKLELLSTAILDIKLHTQNLSLDDARDMLRRQVFMEAGAIDSAVRRIQLTPTESTVAYVGSLEWLRVKDFYQETTTDFSLTSFHGKALTAGPMPAMELTYASTEGEGIMRDGDGE